jgi:flagellar biosynthetic protein FliO
MFLWLQANLGAPLDYGIFIVETLVALGVIALVAWAMVRFGGPRLLRHRGASRMKIVERLSLDSRRALFIVEVDGETLLLGVADNSVVLLKGPDTTGENPSNEAGQE